MKKFDLVVVGGGFAGTAAAVSAARQGMRVLLIEESGCLGGAPSQNLILPFMRYFARGAENNKMGEAVNRGLFLEILHRLKQCGGLIEDDVTFNEEILKFVFDDLCAEAGVEVLFHSRVVSVRREGPRICSVRAEGRFGGSDIGAEYFADCTGDADVVAEAGLGFRKGRPSDGQCQPMTLCFRVANVDMDRFWTDLPQISKLYWRAKQAGGISNPRDDVLLFGTAHKGIIHFNTTRLLGFDPTDDLSMSRAETEGRKQVREMFAFLKKNVPSFADCTLLSIAQATGVRESRMIEGEYTVTAEDLLSCRRFEDSVACGAYEIDIHHPDDGGTTLRPLGEGEYYTIPYRSLLPKGGRQPDRCGALHIRHARGAGSRARDAYRMLFGRGGGACRSLCGRRAARRRYG